MRRERAALVAEVTLESEHNFWDDLTGDVSMGGVFVATYDLPRVGEIVDLTLTIPGERRPFWLRGMVSWLREDGGDGLPVGCGIEWIDLPPIAHFLISLFTHERETLLYEV